MATGTSDTGYQPVPTHQFEDDQRGKGDVHTLVGPMAHPRVRTIALRDTEFLE